jgi:phosphate transport system ATP-binding protein
VLLLDEPCSALDPISTQVIEETIVSLRSDIAIVIVTHNLQQAQRVADHVGFMYLGDLVEYGEAQQVFGASVTERTREYVSGGFG